MEDGSTAATKQEQGFSRLTSTMTVRPVQSHTTGTAKLVRSPTSVVLITRPPKLKYDLIYCNKNFSLGRLVEQISLLQIRDSEIDLMGRLALNGTLSSLKTDLPRVPVTQAVATHMYCGYKALTHHVYFRKMRRKN